jgi:hypothetical protein
MKIIKSGILTLGNYLSNLNRNRVYIKKLNKGSKIKILCEGDSWIHYPFSANDLYNYLNSNDNFALYSIAEGGKTLKKIRSSRSYLSAIKKIQPHFFIISGGGNDLIKGFDYNNFIEKDTSLELAYVKFSKEGESFFADIGNHFFEIFSLIHLNFPNLKILCHGYSYPISSKNKVLEKSFFKFDSITDTHKESFIKAIVDRFNKELYLKSIKFPNVSYFDIRNHSNNMNWKDDIHLRDYKLIGSLIETRINHINQKKKVNG